MNRNVLAYLLLSIVLLTACVSGSERSRMAQIIAEADSMNRNYVPMTSDTLLIEACRFYDRHGSANEQLKVHYLLGCVYRDLGEAPHAVECYQDAIDRADTTSADCDYRTLGCVYSQMADVFHQQLLLKNEIEARKASIYIFNASDKPYSAYSELKLIAGVYALQNINDSAELLVKQALDFFYQNGYIQDAIKSSTTLMHLYIDNPNKQAELKQLIDKYDEGCDYFDNRHELPLSTVRQFYYYKGRCYENLNQLDSAEYYYRKVYYPGIPCIVKDPMYRGLLSVFNKRHQSDSIAKYAQLFCLVNDSSIAIKDKELTAQLAASYNYNYYKRLSLENERNAYRNWLIAIVITIISSFLIILSIYLGKIIKVKLTKEVNLLKQELEVATNEYEQKIKTLQQLDETHKQAINDAYHALASLREEKETSLVEYDKAQNTINQINEQYELEKARLLKEIDDLKYRIEELKNCQTEENIVENEKDLTETEIVRKLKTLSKVYRLMNSEDAYNLKETFKMYHPHLMNDLLHERKFNKTDITVCLLAILDFSPAAICNLTSLSSSSVTNIRAKVNKHLFGDKSASTLYKNIAERYHLSI